MARAIQKIVHHVKTDEQQHSETQEAMMTSVTESADAIREALHLLNQLHDKEFLAMANAVLEQGTPILEVLVNQAKKPEYASGLKNALGLLQLLGKLDVSVLARAVDAIGAAEERVKDGSAVDVAGVFKLLAVMRDPDIRRGLSFALEVLRSLGSGLDSNPVN